MPRSTRKQDKGFVLNHDLPSVEDVDYMLTGPRDIIPADLAAELGLPAGTPLGMIDDGDADPSAYHPPTVSGGELAGRSLGATPTPPREPPLHEPEPYLPPDQRPDEPDDDYPGENEPWPVEKPDEDDPSIGTLNQNDPTLVRPAARSYESRIRILSAWQYLGAMKTAPDWVDRNWLAWGDYDQLRDIPPGPALRIPMPNGENVMCRIGDYVCRQSVTLSPGVAPDIRVEVWEQKQFEKMFVPGGYLEGVTRTIEHENLATQAVTSTPPPKPGRAPPA